MTFDSTRRRVLQGLGGLALGGLGAVPLPARGGDGLAGVSVRPAAPNPADLLAGVHAVAEKSVAAGSHINFRVSSEHAYSLAVRRLGWSTDGPSSGDWLVHDFGTAAARRREVRPGSYVHVERSLPISAQASAVTLECWVRRFGSAWQGVITQYDYPNRCGLGLFLDDQGRPCAYFGDGASFRGSSLVSATSAVPLQTWIHLAATFDEGVVQIYMNGASVAMLRGQSGKTTPGAAPLRLGAYGENNATIGFLQGDLAMPVIYQRALAAGEIARRFEQTPPQRPTSAGVVGCWPLDEEGSDSVADVSGLGRDGVIVNRGTWMIGGPGYDARLIGRYDAAYDPDADPQRGHGLRLSPDDLYAVDWPVSHSLYLPDTLKPGLYVGRIESQIGRYDSTFVVRPSVNVPRAPILVLCSTNTWMAYNGEPFPQPQPHPPVSAARYSFYREHDHGGMPGYQLGMDLPWPSADPYAIYYAAHHYSHLVRAERFLHVWLERNGYDYDVAADMDLDADPALLGQYPLIMIAGHSEYWSRPAYDGLQSYIESGGKVVVASGNSLFWRVSIADGVIECRKHPNTVGGNARKRVGELYHTHDHQRGGLAREAGMPAWRAIGLECVGYDGPRAAYEVSDETHPFFHQPEAVGLTNRQPLGGGLVVGHEYDVTLGRISGTPAIPPGYAPTVLATCSVVADSLDYECKWRGQRANTVISEVSDWQRINGGRVFAAGSIDVGRALHVDRPLASLFRNALDQMGVVFRLNVLAVDAAGRLQNKWFDGRQWGPSVTAWQDMGGGFDTAAAGVMWSPNQLAVAAVTAGGQVHYRRWNGSNWSGWYNFGGSFQGRPALVAWGRNRLEIFCRGRDDRLYQKSWTGTAWTGWRDLGAGACSSPTAIVWEGSRLAVAVLGPAGEVRYKWWDAGSGWRPSTTGWHNMGGAFAHAPTLVSWGGHLVNLFAVDAAGAVHNRWWNGAAWQPSPNGWQNLGGNLASAVAAGVREGNELSLFGTGSDGRLKVKWWDGSAWGGWQDRGGSLVGEPAVASYRGRHLSLLAKGSNGRLLHRLWNGQAWAAWQDLGGALRGTPAVFAWIESRP